MNRLEELSALNSVPILSVHGDEFKNYGRVISGYDFSELISYMEEHTDIPQEGNVYVASVPEMEALAEVPKIRDSFYGGMPIQAGYCNGRNSTYNGFEYHKGSEINIAVTDFMLVLGHSWDISERLTYHVAEAQVFYIEKGTAIEMYQTTLHLSPLRTQEEGFKGVVILPKGTNTPLTEDEKKERDAAIRKGDAEARLLLQRNKWVIAHPEREPLIKQGAWPGVLGKNRRLLF